MINNIISFILLIFIAYIMGMMIVTLIDRHLSRISINLPQENNGKKKEDNNQQDNNQQDNNQQDNNQQDKNKIEAFDNYEDNEDNEKKFCLINHEHDETCNKGKMNMEDPKKMSPIDRRYFKYNFRKNYTLQDYVNWLWEYHTTKEELPYEHMRNLNLIENGKIITEIPNTNLNMQNIDYYKKIYNNLPNNFTEPRNYQYESYNIGNYPTK